MPRRDKQFIWFLTPRMLRPFFLEKRLRKRFSNALILYLNTQISNLILP